MSEYGGAAMSLTSMIKTNKAVRDLLSDYLPKSSDYVSNTSFPAFSKKNEIQVPALVDSKYSGFIGTCSDYLLRFYTARMTHTPAVLDNMVAEVGLRRLTERMNEKNGAALIKAFQDQKNKVKAFIDGTGKATEIFYPCIMFANLDNIVRVGIRTSTIKEAAMAVVTVPDKDVIQEVVDIGNVFIKVVKATDFLHKDSTIIFNPKFGRYGALCGGADADIFIEGCLYDFKSTKDIGYHQNYAAQLLGYYFLSRIEDDLHEGDLAGQQIKYLGIYFSRYGVMCKVPVPEIPQEAIEEFKINIALSREKK